MMKSVLFLLSIDLNDLKPITIKYSKYSKNLDKVFTGKSVESLHYQIKNPKRFHINSLINSNKDKNHFERLEYK